MTTNVADYIASGITSRPFNGWPKDKLDDGWRVGVYYSDTFNCDNYYILYFNDDKSRFDIQIRLHIKRKIYIIDRMPRSKEEFLDYLSDKFPIAFQWCLFNLDLIGV